MQASKQKKKMHITVILLTAAAILLGTFQIYRAATSKNSQTIRSKIILSNNQRHKRSNNNEIILTQNFITKQLSGQSGVYTNWKDTKQNQNAASGHEVLSESYGILLYAYALERDKFSFDKTWSQLQNTLSLDTGWSYRFSPKWGKKYPVNAAIDDLRILFALRLAAHVFSDSSYERLADKYSDRFRRYLIKNSQMYDFYDSTSDRTNDHITLCYIELKWLNLLSMDRKEKKELIHRMTTILQNGYISNRLPLYKKNYNYSSKQYDSSKKINTTESLLSILSLTESGIEKARSIDFIKEKVFQKQLVNAYYQDGSAADTNQSAANYAIAAMIASEIKDENFYKKSIYQMNSFKVKDTTSVFNGGFGYLETKEFYSFNNLMALLAYNY